MQEVLDAIKTLGGEIRQLFERLSPSGDNKQKEKDMNELQELKDKYATLEKEHTDTTAELDKLKGDIKTMEAEAVKKKRTDFEAKVSKLEEDTKITPAEKERIMVAFERMSKLDGDLDEHIQFAFSEKLGFLTSCPTNVGTGLRVSAMVHLPGLVHNKDIGQIIDGLRNVRLTVRGLYGEGTEIMGNFVQISNSITLGLSEGDTVKNLESHVRKVLEFEKKAREVLLTKARSLLEDKIWRAYGICKTARIVTSKEAMGLISAVRMGVGLGVITDVKLAVLNELLIMIQPMHLQRLHNRAMEPEERDRVRADHIRATLAEKRSRNGN